LTDNDRRSRLPPRHELPPVGCRAISDPLTFTGEYTMATDNPYGAPLESSWAPPDGQRKTIIRQIGILSSGKVLGTLYAFLGLIGGAIFSLMALVGASAQGADGASMVIFGVGSIIFLPLFYGLLGAIGGMIGAAVYNLIAHWVGGLEVTVSDS
jgi:hypothetical protein